MAHELEMFSDGTGSFFSARQDPWHRLGIVTASALTAEDAMTTARLDWKVDKVPVYAGITIPEIITDDGVTAATIQQIPVPGKWATVRLHPETGLPDPLGVVGDSYTVVQNIENAEFLNALVGEAGAHFETAGSLNGGRRTFISMKVPGDVKVGGHDAVDQYLVATNSHDGSSAFQVLITPVRVVCANTLSWALKQTTNTIKIRHTSGATNAVRQARDVMGITNSFMAEFEAMANGLIAQKFSKREFGQLVDKIWVPTLEKTKTGEKETKGTLDRREALYGLWVSETQKDIRNTRWAALNAVVEYADWLAPVWTKEGTVESDAVARASRIANGTLSVTQPKQRALALLTA